MSFFRVVRKGLTLLFLTSSLYFLGYDESSRTIDKKSALALITTYDSIGATEGMEEMFLQDFSDLPNYKLNTERVDNLEGLLRNIRQGSLENSIDALILAFHGNMTGLRISENERIDVQNVSKIFKDYSQFFSEDAVIFLYVCFSGIGDPNIAISLAEVLDREVIAPRYTLIPENHLKPEERVGEFIPDKNGRISMDFDNFRIYDEIDFGGQRFPMAIATRAYRDSQGHKIRKDASGKPYFLIVKGR